MYIYIYILVISGGDWFGFKEVADGTRMGLGRVLWEAAQRPSSFQAQSHSHQNYSNMIIERINHSRFRFFSEKSSAWYPWQHGILFLWMGVFTALGQLQALNQDTRLWQQLHLQLPKFPT